jgi:hypothetical protein
MKRALTYRTVCNVVDEEVTIITIEVSLNKAAESQDRRALDPETINVFIAMG